jgi:plasmid segregation protein ParM
MMKAEPDRPAGRRAARGAASLKKAALEKVMTGSHDVGGGTDQVSVVRKALAVAQPQGALVHYAPSTRSWPRSAGAEPGHRPGSRTFDWLVCRGMRLVQKQSHSINRGMSDVLKLLAAEISKDIGTPYRDYDAIDLALRTGKAPVIFQKPYDIKRHLPLAESVAQQAVSTMRQWIETPESLQNIILVGGGAFLFKKAVKAAFPQAPDPRGQGACVRQREGLPAGGQNYAMTSLATPAPSDRAPGGGA